MFRYYYKNSFTYAGYQTVFTYEIWDRFENRRIGAVYTMEDTFKIIDLLNEPRRSKTSSDSSVPSVQSSNRMDLQTTTV